MERSRASPWFVLLAAVVACSDGKSDRAPCEGDACELDAQVEAPPSTATRDAGARDGSVRPATFSTDAEAGKELQARVQVNGANVGCGSCAVVIAQVQGGELPYTYQWSDPSLTGPGPHSVCPTSPTTYSVVVSDGSEIVAGEFAQPAQQVEATGRVDCVADAGTEGLIGCFTSGGLGAGDGGVDAGNDAGTAPFMCPEPGDAGVTFDLERGTVGTVTVSTEIVQGLLAGHTYEYSHDRLLPFTLSVGEGLTVDVYGAREPCVPAEKFFTLTYDIVTWHQAFCFTPKEDYKYMIVAVHLDGVLFSFEFLTSGTACAGCSMK